MTLNGQEMSAELLSAAQCYYRIPKRAGEPTPLLKLNSERIGFYRVLYSNELFDKLIEAVEKGAQRELLLPIERCGLLSDSFEFAKMDLLELGDAMRLLWAFHSETDNKFVFVVDLELSADSSNLVFSLWLSKQSIGSNPNGTIVKKLWRHCGGSKSRSLRV